MNKIPGVYYCQLKDFSERIQEFGILVNGVLQDVNNPLMFVRNSAELRMLRESCHIIDISCDKGMGFYFAEPTSFEKPIIELERGISYYSVDHTPTYLWNVATSEISRAVLPFLEVVSNPDSNPVI